MSLMQNVDWQFSQIMQGIQMHTAHINSKMDEKFGSLERTLGQLTADVNKLSNMSARTEKIYSYCKKTMTKLCSDWNNWNKNYTH